MSKGTLYLIPCSLGGEQVNQVIPSYIKEVINNLEEKELAQIFKYFGDEKDSKRIAHNIVEDRANRKITTEELVRIIESSKRKKNYKIHSATKVLKS